MRAMIFAAGMGTRLKPLTDTRPKALVEVQGVPMLEIVLRRLVRFGFKEIVVNVHHFSEMVVDFLEKNDIKAENVLFMGDDLVDFRIMNEVGIPTCPADAVSDIIAISDYVSDKNGGEGCVRDVIEQTLREHGKWFTEEMLKSRAF